jgi:predicted permease
MNEPINRDNPQPGSYPDLLALEDRQGCSSIEKFILPIAIIIAGILLGKGMRELWEKRLLPDSIPIELMLKRIIQLVLLGVNPLIILGAFWFVKLDSMKLALLPLLGVLTLVLGGILALSISKIQKLDRPKTGAMFVSGAFTNMGSFGGLFCFVFIGPETVPYIAMFRLLEEFVYYAIGFPIAKMFGSTDEPEGQGKKKLIKLLADPYILFSLLSIVIGCILNISPWERPAVYGDFIAYAVPLSTLLLVIPIGFSMKVKAIRGYLRECCSIAAVKFLMVPVAVTTLAYFLGIGQLENHMVLKVILILTAMPPAFTSLIPPQLYKLDGDLANSSWLFNSALLLLVAPILYYVVSSM